MDWFYSAVSKNYNISGSEICIYKLNLYKDIITTYIVIRVIYAPM